MTPLLTEADMARVPALTEKPTWMSAAPESTSMTEIPSSARFTSSEVVSAAGSVRVGPSLTAVTVMVSVVEAVCTPPEPALPWSSALRVRVTGPLKSAAGMKRTPPVASKVAASSVSVPVSVTAAVPSPVTPPAGTPPATVVSIASAPESTVSCAVTLAPPASRSVTDSPVMFTAVSSAVVGGAPVPTDGASLTARMVIAMVSMSPCAPPAPVAPRSLLEIVRDAAPLTSLFGEKISPPEAARVVFRVAGGAVTVTALLPLPVTMAAVTPPDTFVRSASTPSVAVRLTWMLLPPMSTSLTASPVTSSGVSSSVLRVAGALLTGASLTAVTLIDRLPCGSSEAPLSSTTPTISVSTPMPLPSGW